MVTPRGGVKVLDFGLAEYAPGGERRDATWSAGAPRRRPGRSGHGRLHVPRAGPGRRGRRAAATSSRWASCSTSSSTGERPFTGAKRVEVIDAILRASRAAGRCRATSPAARRSDGRRAADAREGAERPTSATCATSRRSWTRSLRGARRSGVRRRLAPSPRRGGHELRQHHPHARGRLARHRHRRDRHRRTSRRPGAPVVARERVLEVLRKLAARGDEEALAARLGRELGARLVVSGGYQRLGEQVRVTARLTDVARRRDPDREARRDAWPTSSSCRTASWPSWRPARACAAERPRDGDETHGPGGLRGLSKGLLNLRAESAESLDRAILLLRARRGARSAATRAPTWSWARPTTVEGRLPGRAGAPRARAREPAASALAPAPGLVRGWRELGCALLALGSEDEGSRRIRAGPRAGPRRRRRPSPPWRGCSSSGAADFASAADVVRPRPRAQPARRLVRAPARPLRGRSCGELRARREDAARRAIELQEAVPARAARARDRRRPTCGSGISPRSRGTMRTRSRTSNGAGFPRSRRPCAPRPDPDRAREAHRSVAPARG